MKRINNKGVVLLETLLVSVFVLSIFIFIYRNSIPMMGLYEKLETYDDVDSVYAANMIKNLVITYIPDNYISGVLLSDKNYADISDCNDTNLYSDSSYCQNLKNRLHIEPTDIIYITRYNEIYLEDFREEVNNPNNDLKFAAGENAGFRDYLKTVANNESFYNPNDDNKKVVGVYRIFISRTVPMMDGTTIKKYANIGIYKTNYVGD